MWCISFKLTKGRLIFSLLVCFVLAYAVIHLVTSSSTMAVSNQLNLKPDMTTELSDNTQRLSFLSSFGFELSEEPVLIKDILIPEEFSESYAKYNQLQLEQGLNLEKFKGKYAKLYSYQVLNYPDYQGVVQANLILYNDNVIACDIASSELDGFVKTVDCLLKNSASSTL